MITSETIAARDAAYDARQNEERRLIALICHNANRIAPALWSAEIDGTRYYVQERYDGRRSWRTVHVDSANGPRVG